MFAVPATPATRKRRREANVDLPLESVIIGTAAEIKPRLDNFQKINWRKPHLQLHIQQINFRSAKNLPDSFKAIKTPYDCFEYFVDDKVYKNIADQTNLYARNKNINTKFMTNTADIRKFVGIVMQMSVIRHYSTRTYWGKNSIDAVRNTMPCTQFETLRQNLYFNDNAQIIEDKINRNYDLLFKVRPLINIFNERFGSVTMPQRLCVDEQMCATKMKKNPVRQYMSAKPHKWGTKLFVLCDSAGFSYKFEVYADAGDNILQEGAPDLGASANVVVRLSQLIPDQLNHILYFDNFYASVPLLVYLRSRGIFSLGTVRQNRIPNCKFTKEKNMTNKSRGYSEENVGIAYGVEISSVM